MLSCKLDDDRVLHVDHVLIRAVPLGAVGASERTVADRNDPFRFHVCAQLLLGEGRMELQLRREGADRAVPKEQTQLRLGHVADADMPNHSFSLELFHAAPRIHELLVNIGNRVGVALIHMGKGRVMVGKRPVDEEEIKVIGLKILHAQFGRPDDIRLPVHVIPDLAGKPQVAALDLACREHFSDLPLIVVHPGAVDHPIPDRQRFLHRRGHHVGGNMVGTERTHTDLGNV